MVMGLGHKQEDWTSAAVLMGDYLAMYMYFSLKS